MDNNSERDLKNQENWDFEHPELKEPVKAPRVVFSVAFKREDFNTISDCAERLGKKTSEFIREAALEKATGRASQTWSNTFSGASPIFEPSYLLNDRDTKVKYSAEPIFSSS